MATKYRITPKPNAKLRHPDPPHDYIPAAGILVEKVAPFWKRRELEGGVTITPEPAAPQPTRAPASPSPSPAPAAPQEA